MEKVNANGNSSNLRERIMKVLLKNFYFSQIFQKPGLRKMNIANTESIFDQNEYDILVS